MSRASVFSPDDPSVPFEPHPLASGADAQTMLAYFFPDTGSFPHTRYHPLVLSGGDRALVMEDRPRPPRRPTGCALLVHGLGGHGESRYGVRVARRLVDAGLKTIRFSMRGTLPRKDAAAKLYNAGASDDLACAISAASTLADGLPIVIVGFSLGGNIVLKYLSEGRDDIPESLVAGVAINPPIDLERCVETISARRNLLYDQNFVALLKMQMRGRPGRLVDPATLALTRRMTLRKFDDLVTAPVHGFDDGAHYYRESSAGPLLRNLARDAVILASDDDPFIPSETFNDLQTDRLHVNITRGGGHMGYLSRVPTPLGDRRWMDYAVLWYVLELLGGEAPRSIYS